MQIPVDLMSAPFSTIIAAGVSPCPHLSLTRYYLHRALSGPWSNFDLSTVALPIAEGGLVHAASGRTRRRPTVVGENPDELLIKSDRNAVEGRRMLQAMMDAENAAG